MQVLNDILKKDINRVIDGVIKADDSTHIFQEVEEYVLTKEISKYLEKLIDGYRTSIEKSITGEPYPYNGVWISGYFGSGKSHLLKVLSYLLENSVVDGKRLIDLFIPKVEDQFLRGNLQKIVKVPSKSILFNIDSQADAALSRDVNQILYIFEKVFNHMLGYSTERREIAEFERHLDEEGELELFKEKYLEINKVEWQKDRNKALGLGRQKLIKVLKDYRGLSEENAVQLIENYKSGESLSVESFVNRVKTWMDKQENKQFRLNFFIDEVGQFIANNTRLMLNLQTITETFATVCKGRVWIFVTGQEDLDSIVGDPEVKQTYDFTKILARFHHRVTLSSRDVEEVIQKRLLEKTEEGRGILGELYMKEKDSIRTIFSFRHGGKDIRFKDKNRFVQSYPFQAYQYNLLHEALNGLSVHNAFIGRHVARGERSMLEIFQDVSKKLQYKQLFTWATFDQMFEGIKNTLKTSLITAINTAEKELENKMAIRLLKILLLVKYVRDFMATSEHLKVLCIDKLDTDFVKLQEELQEALEILEQQTYIRRNGDIYEYLTNEEKDVEEEIKKTPVEISELRKFFDNAFYSEIVKSTKIRHQETDEDYSYKKAIDEEVSRGGGNSDLVIRLITPFHPLYSDTNRILQQAFTNNELLIFIEPEDNFNRELKLYFQTDTYTRQNLGTTSSVQIARIIQEKQTLNIERRNRLVEEFKKITGRSKMYVRDQLIDPSTNDPRERVGKGFQKLIAVSYPNLRMLKIHYTEDSLRKIIFSNDKSALYSEGGLPIEEAEKEMLNFIKRKEAQHERVTISDLLKTFMVAPYGWYVFAVICILAKLYMRNQLEIMEGTETKNRHEVYDMLRKNRGYENYTVKSVRDIEIGKIEALKEFYREYFPLKNIQAKTAKEVAIEFKNQWIKEVEDIERNYLSQKTTFPFVDKLSLITEKYRKYLNHEWEFIFEELDNLKDELLRDRNRVIDPIKTFLNGNAKRGWLNARDYIEHQRLNFPELGMDEEINTLLNYMENDEPYNNNLVKKINDLLLKIQKREKVLLEDIRKEAVYSINEMILEVKNIDGFEKLKEEKKREILESLTHLANTEIPSLSIFSVIRDRVETKGKKLLEDAKKQIRRYVGGHDINGDRYASREEKKIPFPKTALETRSDVNDYAEALRKHYYELIENNKKIKLE